ncbi:flagellar hook assembly protein FlgD [Pigmentiphaga aceris]|uniref:Basal-body rod modification protein FlgD n=1 Tax=Pigmentiphaga aceris TaxID=1940612 RepID=A0A5C0B222_9BURK|nr:flagellar hook assembly protein FlgD [Pigmentiphaga aceris]QEI07220.1 flagellar hook assembly protein FlgD [Pigmentiphaga aceris]
MSLTVNSGASTAPIATTTTKDTTANDLSEQFLKMLVAQMQNQDPMNPMDNAQLTSQLAQISTVNGISSLNDTVAGLGSNLAGMQSMQAAALVGRDVEVPGKTLVLEEDSTVRGGFDVPYAVENAKLTIANADGAVVYTSDMGKTKAGTTHFDWDGKDSDGNQLPPGTYTFDVQLTASGVTGAATTLSTVTVQSIQPGAAGTRVIDKGGNQYNMSAVRQIS